jgi:hypothetical protein
MQVGDIYNAGIRMKKIIETINIKIYDYPRIWRGQRMYKILVFLHVYGVILFNLGNGAAAWALFDRRFSTKVSGCAGNLISAISVPTWGLWLGRFLP